MDYLRFGIEQGESGAPVAVTWLADGAGIDHVTRVRLQLQRDRLGLSDGAVFGTETVGAGTVGEESTLQVGMAEEGDRRRFCEERDECVADGNDVNVLISGRAMDELGLRDTFQRDRALWQSVQPFVVLWC